MNTTEYHIEGMTIAIQNMDQMLNFYSHVFKIDFIEKEKYGSKLYYGSWSGLKLLFCPAEIAQNTATQNRHQFDITVKDVRAFIKAATKHGGEVMGEIYEDENSLSAGIYDPDKNSMTLKQLK